MHLSGESNEEENSTAYRHIRRMSIVSLWLWDVGGRDRMQKSDEEPGFENKCGQTSKQGRSHQRVHSVELRACSLFCLQLVANKESEEMV